MMIIDTIENECIEVFRQIDRIALINQKKVLNAFRKNRISETHFHGTTGYGYGDSGREKLSQVFADIFHTESAIVSPAISGGTHAISLCLQGVLRPGHKVLSITGKPYDTLVSSIWGNRGGSLEEYGITFECLELLSNGDCDIAKMETLIANGEYTMLYVQRSRGYDWRSPLKTEDMRQLFSIAKRLCPQIIIMVDNCYGEFVGDLEPTQVGADLVAGSLIKNPGGGIAPTGGYICGNNELIELISYKLTAPGLGMEVGSYAYGYREFFQGLFLAPHVTAQALKACVLFTVAFSNMGYMTLPKAKEYPGDIISSIQFETESELVEFCRSIQSASPIDSFVIPYPWDMPGYEHKVIMAAGAFVQGSSIELSCDAPIKSPYRAYVQGGLTYEHARIAVEECVTRILGRSAK